MSEIRLDRIHNKYVLIAPERLYRPNVNDLSKKKSTNSTCPFCEGNEDLTPNEVYAMRENGADLSSWKTRVVPNLYKAVQIELEDGSSRDGMFESVPGVGAHEILIDSPCHNCDLVDLDVTAVENWLRSMIIRIEDLKNDKRLIYLSIFKNVGQNAGATQDHPHTQILALPIMPKSEMLFLERNLKYYNNHGRGILEDVLHNEMLAKTRVLNEIGNFLAFCPFASAYPFEVMIAPTVNIASLSKCSRKDITDLSALIKRVFEKLSIQLGRFDYNLSFDMIPLNKNFENEQYFNYFNTNYRFCLRITPRIYNLGGFEISTGMAINSVPPEECAKLLRGD
ncbi:galactose-1-phosphate uridylyltransferase [bacterium]|nr:galactose-1-phosphate uridylyltransferase [bacterium]MBU1883555.1 galactose-1-phosphate uridylyltransferase [bacterium]